MPEVAPRGRSTRTGSRTVSSIVLPHVAGIHPPLLERFRRASGGRGDTSAKPPFSEPHPIASRVRRSRGRRVQARPHSPGDTRHPADRRDREGHDHQLPGDRAGRAGDPGGRGGAATTPRHHRDRDGTHLDGAARRERQRQELHPAGHRPRPRVDVPPGSRGRGAPRLVAAAAPGTTNGRVLLEFTEGSRSTSLQRAERGSSGDPARGRLRAWLRRDPAAEPGRHPAEPNVRLGNLFDAQVPVINAERWLLESERRRLQRRGRGDRRAHRPARGRGVRRGQPVGDALVQRTGGEVTIGGEPLDTLSDGYRAVIATACDLMAGAGAGLSDMRNATGIVLVDELGAHLHPRWKMDITGTLRRVFPSMQFIVTTHEPLCLLGLVENEVILVRPSTTHPGAPWHAIFDGSPSRPAASGSTGCSRRPSSGSTPRSTRAWTASSTSTTRSSGKELTPSRRATGAACPVLQHGVLGYTARDQMVTRPSTSSSPRSPR